MVLNRNHILRSTQGYSLGFVKDEPMAVPYKMLEEALAIGAAYADKEEQTKVEKVQESEPVLLTGKQRAEKIDEAIEKMVTKNDSKEFTAAGTPKVTVIEKIVGFDTTTTEVAARWQARNDRMAAGK